jgi:outer membrane protein
MRHLLFNSFLLSFVLLLAANPGFSASLTLDDCLRLAKEHNPLLQTARWDQAVADETVRQADSSLYPRVDMQGGYTAQLEPQAMKVLGQSMETQQASYPFANLSITQTIYDFGKREARRNQAKAASQAVGSGIRSREQEVALQVIEAFFAALEGEKLIITAKEELGTVEEHRRVAQALFDNGVVTRNDLLQADVRMASARQKLLAVQNRVTNLKLQLNFLLGTQENSLPELVEPSINTFDAAKTGEISRALNSRPDLNLIRKQIEASEHEISESRTFFYPELYARGTVDYLQNEKVREQTVYAGTIGIKINLFDGFASTATREKAVNQRSRNQQQLKLAEAQARLEIEAARNDAQVALERIAVTLEAIKQGEENLRINQNRYQERVGTATEVLDARTLLTQTKTEHYRAFYDHQVATARLRKALGEL